jgi:hypothetical protein
MKNTATSIHKEIQELRASVTPLILDSTDFFTRVAPQIEATTNDVAEIVHMVREKTVVIESTVSDVLERAQRQTARVDEVLTGVLERTQRQTARVDGMVTNALDSVEKAGGFIDKAVKKPVRQISALVAAGRAIVQSLNATAPRSHSANGSGNHDRLA